MFRSYEVGGLYQIQAPDSVVELDFPTCVEAGPVLKKGRECQESRGSNEVRGCLGFMAMRCSRMKLPQPGRIPEYHGHQPAIAGDALQEPGLFHQGAPL